MAEATVLRSFKVATLRWSLEIQPQKRREKVWLCSCHYVDWLASIATARRLLHATNPSCPVVVSFFWAGFPFKVNQPKKDVDSFLPMDIHWASEQ